MKTTRETPTLKEEPRPTTVTERKTKTHAPVEDKESSASNNDEYKLHPLKYNLYYRGF
jgi:hypothetical protein